MATIKAEVASIAAPRALELLAPQYTDLGELAASTPVVLSLSASLEVQLSFPGLDKVKEVECINVEQICPRCKYQALLRSFVLLHQRGEVQINADYVLNKDRNYALLRLHVGVLNQGALEEFAFVKDHLQPVQESAETSRAKRLRAKESSCHVVGCTSHRWEHPRPALSTSSALKQEKQEAVTKQEPATKQETTDVPTVANEPSLTGTIDLTLSSDSEQEDEAQDEVVTIPSPPAEAMDTPVQEEPVATPTVRAASMNPTSPPRRRVTPPRRLNLPEVYHSLMAHVEDVPTDIWDAHVPGLKLRLFEHQRRGLTWMKTREDPALWDTVLRHPFSVPHIDDEDPDFRKSASELEHEFNEAAMDSCGGMLCDEPGLGKTITMLALILLSKGESTENMTARVDPPTVSGSAQTFRCLRPRDRPLSAMALEKSSATLLICPDALVQHWHEQIQSHVVRKTIKLFVDKGGDLPSSSKLAQYDVVLLSFSRMAKEWKLHRPPSALEQRRVVRYGFEDQPPKYLDGNVQGELSQLLMVHWLRVVVDEGHKLGGRAPTQLMLMSRLLCAERRWIMSGTPSPNTDQASDLQYLHGLLLFLRNQPFGSPDGLAWNAAIATPFTQHRVIGFYRLQHLLRRIMIRHTKDSIREGLPHPIRHKVVIDPTRSEFNYYNGIAAEVRANLCLTQINPKEPKDIKRSLLNPRNFREIEGVEDSLRVASTGGFYMEWLSTSSKRDPTLKKLQNYCVSERRMAAVIAYLDTVAERQKTPCEECLTSRRTLMVLPCGHLVCPYCVENSKKQYGHPWCVLCSNPFDADAFDYLQPTRTDELTAAGRRHTIETLCLSGVDELRMSNVLKYLDTIEAKPATQCQSCKRELHMLLIVPCGHLCCPDCVSTRFREVGPSCCICTEPYHRKEFVKLQPAIRFLAVPEDKPQQKSTLSDGSKRKRDTREVDYKRDYWKVDSSKIFYIASRVRELRREFAQASGKARPVKVIIFSQSRECIWRAKLSLNQQDIATADFISLIKPRERVEHLNRFRSNPHVNVLLLSDMGSHGLDLSFVTHIFLLEEIWDKSLEQQVICRAHRIGATGPVVVEQLWMKGSIEVQQGSAISRAGAVDDSTRERIEQESMDVGDRNSFYRLKANYILSNLRMLESDVVSPDGEVRFAVLDEVDAIIRQGIYTLSESGQLETISTMPRPPPEPTPEAPRDIFSASETESDDELEEKEAVTIDV